MPAVLLILCAVVRRNIKLIKAVNGSANTSTEILNCGHAVLLHTVRCWYGTLASQTMQQQPMTHTINRAFSVYTLGRNYYLILYEYDIVHTSINNTSIYWCAL